jgi:DNA polymerase/3'-5' exonuclease PolX
LESYEHEITNEEQLNNLPTIGKAMKKKIIEILNTGQLERTKNFMQDESL